MSTACVSTLTLRVRRKLREALSIVTFELVDPAGAELPAFEAGSHLDVHVPGGPVRQYSLCNAPVERHRYVIGVLRDPASRGGSQGLHERLHEGDLLTVSAPKNHFALDETSPHSLLLAGGIGVTPLLCMAERLAQLDRAFELHYCTRSKECTAFVERLAQAPFAHQVHLHHDDGPPAQQLDLTAVLRNAVSDTHLYVCGPTGFMNAVLGSARAAGWAENRLHSEFFSGAVVSAAETAEQGSFELKLARSGRVLRVPADKSAAAMMIESGVDLPLSCEQGVCGTCLTRVLEGLPDHRDLYLTAAEQALNDQFTPCCSRARSAVLVIDR